MLTRFCNTKIFRQGKLTIFVLLLLPLLLRLGFWQLDRAEEKQLLLESHWQQQELPSQPWPLQSVRKETHYQPINVKGRFDTTHYWLLDNQSREGQVGYEVIMPLIIESNNNEKLLVNRGWVKAPADRSQLPEIQTPLEFIELTGYLHQPSANAIFSATDNDYAANWPRRVLNINSDIASTQLQENFYPTVLRLLSHSKAAFVTDWKVSNTQPEKHRGYAIQWFSMATILVVLYLYAIYKKD